MVFDRILNLIYFSSFFSLFLFLSCYHSRRICICMCVCYSFCLASDWNQLWAIFIVHFSFTLGSFFILYVCIHRERVRELLFTTQKKSTNRTLNCSIEFNVVFFYNVSLQSDHLFFLLAFMLICFTHIERECKNESESILILSNSRESRVVFV